MDSVMDSRRQAETHIITCREFIEFLADYLAGDLSPASQAEFEFHLSDCPDCTLYLKSYEESIRLGKAVCSDLDTPPSDVPEELVQGILAARRRGNRTPP
jgi:predicted anti-sigma-YlaC factor YlaD